MSFQITLTERLNDDEARLLLFGSTNADVPSLLFEYNAALLTTGSMIDATMFPLTDDVGDKLVQEIAGLSWLPVDDLAPGAELLFRIEEDDFLLETCPRSDPRPLLIRYLAAQPTEISASEVLDSLFLWASIRHASRYAAACGWGMDSNAVREAADELVEAENLGM